MLDREKVLNWWTGRITDQELAAWTGMAPRAVGLTLNFPFMRKGIVGGGRGSRNTRRVPAEIRNAVAIVQALNEAGIPLETATNVIGATPVIASLPTEVVDVEDLNWGVRSLLMVDPKGGWLPTDIVPGHIWERHLLLDGSKPPVPVYAGEIDPLGLYLPDNVQPDSLDRYDNHLLIVNGRWIFTKSPLEASSIERGEPTQFDFDPVSVIEPDRKTVRVIGWGRDEAEQERALYYLKNFASLLDVNLTMAVRTMKRRAYGLPVAP